MLAVLQQLRNQASAIADSRALEIIESAQKLRTTGDRFSLIRRHIATPINDREREYAAALKRYVEAKITLHRMKKTNPYGGSAVRADMERWRLEMDRIEFEEERPLFRPNFILHGHHSEM